MQFSRLLYYLRVLRFLLLTPWQGEFLLIYFIILVFFTIFKALKPYKIYIQERIGILSWFKFIIANKRSEGLIIRLCKSTKKRRENSCSLPDLSGRLSHFKFQCATRQHLQGSSRETLLYHTTISA